jgi:hypothetical protein
MTRFTVDLFISSVEFSAATGCKVAAHVTSVSTDSLMEPTVQMHQGASAATEPVAWADRARNSSRLYGLWSSNDDFVDTAGCSLPMNPMPPSVRPTKCRARLYVVSQKRKRNFASFGKTITSELGTLPQLGEER